MADGTRSVLLAGLDDAVARRVVIALDSLGLHFYRAPSLTALGEWARLSDFGVIIVAYTGDRSTLAGVDDLETWSSRNGRRSAVVMLCSSALLNDIEPPAGHGIARVVLLESLESELRQVVSTLLGVAPRFRIQAPVRLTPVPAGDDPGAFGTTENISSSGMLVSCLEELALGSTVRFEITIPDLDVTIRGSARVVRATDPAREGTQGIGAQFVSFLDSGEDRLHDLLSPHVH